MPQRSPVIFWLLLAATLSVDAVAVFWIHVPRPDFGSFGRYYGMIFFYSLTMSQLGVVAIWYTFAAGRSVATSVVPIAAIGLATLLSPYDEVINLADYGAWYGVHTFALMLILWQLRRTSWWPRHRGAPRREPWRYSLVQLVTLMTLVAVLLMLVRNSSIVKQLSPALLLPNLLADIALAIAATMFYAGLKSVVLRAASTFGVAISLGALQILLLRWMEPMAIGQGIVSAYVTQAVVLIVWIELGGIVPKRELGAVADA